MCGIIGAVGSSRVSEIIVSGLKKLEYRGYDSAGIAFYEDKKFSIIKEEGKIIRLENALKKEKLIPTPELVILVGQHMGFQVVKMLTLMLPLRFALFIMASSKTTKN